VSAAAHWSSSRDARPRFRLTPAPEPLEVDLQATCAKVLAQIVMPPCFWFAMPIGHIELSAAQMARLTRIGLKAGLPDFFLLHRGVYCIELKRPGGTLSKTRVTRSRSGAPQTRWGQEDIFPKLLETGAIEEIAVAHSVDEMLAHLVRWQIPMRWKPSDTRL
jgi:hypothetical protein